MVNNFVIIKNASGVEATANVQQLNIVENLNEFSTCSFYLVSESQNEVAIDNLQPFSQVYVPVIGQWFQVSGISSASLVDYRQYNVSCVHIGTRLHNKYTDDKLNGTQGLNACLDYILGGTGFTYYLHDSFPNYTFSDGFGNGYSDDLLLNTLKPDFGFDFVFDNNVIHIYKQLGGTDKFVFVDGYNASKISSTEDYSNMATYVKGTGKPNEGDNATGYQATAEYRSPNADIYGIVQASTISDERFTDSASLQAYLKTQLQDYPIVQYTMEQAQFENNARYQDINDVSLGNYGLVKDRLGIDVDVRIIGKSYFPNDPTQTDTVTFGNKLFDFAYNMSKQQQSQKDNSKIDKEIKGINNNMQVLFDGQFTFEPTGKAVKP